MTFAIVTSRCECQPTPEAADSDRWLHHSAVRVVLQRDQTRVSETAARWTCFGLLWFSKDSRSVAMKKNGASMLHLCWFLFSSRVISLKWLNQCASGCNEWKGTFCFYFYAFNWHLNLTVQGCTVQFPIKTTGACMGSARTQHCVHFCGTYQFIAILFRMYHVVL